MTQYIQIIEETQFNETAGRQSCLKKGTFGYVLNESEINQIAGVSDEIKKCLQLRCIEANEQGVVFALVEGYPCALHSDQYRFISNREEIPSVIKTLILF